MLFVLQLECYFIHNEGNFLYVSTILNDFNSIFITLRKINIPIPLFYLCFINCCNLHIFKISSYLLLVRASYFHFNFSPYCTQNHLLQSEWGPDLMLSFSFEMKYTNFLNVFSRNKYLSFPLHWPT